MGKILLEERSLSGYLKLVAINFCSFEEVIVMLVCWQSIKRHLFNINKVNKYTWHLLCSEGFTDEKETSRVDGH